MKRDEFMKKLSKMQSKAAQMGRSPKDHEKLRSEIKKLEQELCEAAGFDKPEYFC